MDKLQQDIQRMKKEIETLISRKLPVAAGKYAKPYGLYSGVNSYKSRDYAEL